MHWLAITCSVLYMETFQTPSLQVQMLKDVGMAVLKV